MGTSQMAEGTGKHGLASVGGAAVGCIHQGGGPYDLSPIRLCIAALTCVALVLASRVNCKGATPEGIAPGVRIERANIDPLHEETVAAVRSVPPKAMSGTGLVGIAGGVRLKLLRTGIHELLIPLPQLADAQIPVSYTITSNPKEAIVECYLRAREGSNVVVGIRLSGGRGRQIDVTWTAVVLIARKADVGKPDPAEPYLERTSCVQSDAKEITKLAGELWPTSGKLDAFCEEIQRFIGKMQRKQQARSMDALSTLDSGANWICTANANLAMALLRSRGVPARSIAVIPVISKRLEMHRIVEYFDGGRWVTFDPSSLQRDIPTKPWQNVVMAKSTIADEEAAMEPRLGSSLGCPIGQELEFIVNEMSFWGTPLAGATLWGNDFFWTLATPLAEFEDDAEALSRAKREWVGFLETGKLSQRQRRAAVARNAKCFLDALSQND